MERDGRNDARNGSGNGNRNSRFSRKNGLSFLVWAVLVVLVVLILIEVFILVKGDSGQVAPGTPSIGTQNAGPAQKTPEPSKETDPAAPGTPTPQNGGTTETPTPADGTNAPVTEQPATETPAASTESPFPEAARIVDPASIDFSFLNGISGEPFEDGSPLEDGTRSYDWYPGKVVRNEDGTVSKPWDRYASTLAYLDQYGGIYRKNENENVIYLTFDCGYEYGYTARILDTLKEKNVKAIFFVTGGFVNDSSNHGLLKRMAEEGHLIGNHTENHKIMPTVSPQEFVSELNSVYRKCKEILGDSFTMAYYRPPQGASCPRDLALSAYLGYHSTFWSFAYGDYNVDNQPEEGAALENMKSCLHPGAVYLLHAVSSTNTAVLGDFIDYVRAEGFTLKRIDE